MRKLLLVFLCVAPSFFLVLPSCFAQDSESSYNKERAELAEVKLGRDFVLMVDTSIKEIASANFVTDALPFKGSLLIRRKRERLQVLFFCVYSCKPDAGGYWAWVTIPFSELNPSRLRIVTILDPQVTETKVRGQERGDHFELTLILNTPDGWSKWRATLTRAGFGACLDPQSIRPDTLHNADAM